MVQSPSLIRPDQGYDFSGIDHYAHIASPEYAVLIGDREKNEHFRYVEAYPDGTIRHGAILPGDSDGVTIYFNYNPRSRRGYFGDHARGRETDCLRSAQELLLEAGAPEEAVSLDAKGSECNSISIGDTYAWTTRDSAHRLAGTALNALAFSRWYNYEFPQDSPIPEMTRKNYAQALGTIASRFGLKVLANEAKRLATEHFHSLHTDIHTPGLPHRPHSDGTPQGKVYMNTASQVIRNAHNLYLNMRDMGSWVNFLSIFGDTDFWAVTRSTYPSIFNAVTKHILELPDPLIQTRTAYTSGTTVSPVGAIQHYFPEAHQEILTGHPNFKTDITQEQVIRK